MDEVFIASEEDDYYTNGTTTGDSENDSDASSEHGARDFEQ